MRHLLIHLAFFLLPISALATQRIELKLTEPLTGTQVPFVTHTGPGPFDNALALNINLPPIEALRKGIEKHLGGVPLDFLRAWSPHGEAHVTVITPPEFSQILSKYLTMEDIHKIARDEQIQSADITVLGIGSGKKQILSKEESTFFVIVESQTLRRIRLKIWQAYQSQGGKPSDWDPTWFFPHVTIGYTKQDLHEPDVLKNIKHAFDKRFILRQD